MSLLEALRQAIRSCRREPIPAAATILVLTLGLGPVAVLLSLVNAVLFRPWPVRDPGSMAVIEARRTGNEVKGVISIAEYRYLRDHSRTIQGTAAWIADRSRIEVGAGERIFVRSAFVNADYFSVLGARIVAGRAFLADEEDYRTPKAVAIISERLWRGRWGGDRALIGNTVRIGGRPFLMLGASRRRVVGAVLVEAGFLSAIAGLLALALACATPPALLGLRLTFGAQGLERTKAYFVGLRDAVEQTHRGPIAAAEDPPFSDLPLYMMARRPDEAAGRIQQILLRRASRNYFGVLGIPVVRGRVPSDDIDAQEIVVDGAAARMLWPGAN